MTITAHFPIAFVQYAESLFVSLIIHVYKEGHCNTSPLPCYNYKY